VSSADVTHSVSDKSSCILASIPDTHTRSDQLLGTSVESSDSHQRLTTTDIVQELNFTIISSKHALHGGTHCMVVQL